jgi:hypothetical protein
MEVVGRLRPVWLPIGSVRSVVRASDRASGGLARLPIETSSETRRHLLPEG